MSQWAQQHIPCPCGTSSDAYSIRADGSGGYCFSCSKSFNNKKEETVDEGYTYEYRDRRGITAATHEFFGVKTQIDGSGKPTSVAYPYRENTFKFRSLGEKGFWSKGNIGSVGGWGPDKFPAASAKAITITEGEDDAMSVWQMLGKYPVYSVKSAAVALSDVRKDYEYLNSFERIYLCLDDDEPGRRATKEIAAVFGFGKIYHVKNAPLKDAHDFLEGKREKEFKNAWFNASRYMPESILSGFASLKKELENSTGAVICSWPFAGFERMTGGIALHRQYLLSGLEGRGKTEVLHQLVHHVGLNFPKINVGVIHLEEPIGDTLKIQAGKVLQSPVHLPEFAVSNDEVMKAFEKMAGRDDRFHFFKHFGSEDTDTILATMRFMVAACGCQLVVFDNYQLAVTGRSADRDTEALDYLSTRTESLVKELPFALVSISHENDNELTRGSRNLSKTTDVWVNIKRDVENADEHVRNTVFTSFKKNRQAGRTGPGPRLIYDQTKALLSEETGELPS